MNKEEIDNLIDQEMSSMFRENSVKMMSFMVSQMAKQAVESNAGYLKVSQNMTIKGQRYKADVIITIEEIES